MLFDTHVHSHHSPDGCASVEALCLAAVAAGLSGIAVTDHCDIDGVVAGHYAPTDWDGVRREAEAARERFSGTLGVYFGIELGQPSLCPEESARLLREQPFDLVIASCHNLCGVPDFYFMDFGKLPLTQLEELYRRSILELTEHVRTPGVHIAAHLTYPLRYAYRAGRTVDITRFEDDLRRLYHVMRECDVVPELNMAAMPPAGEMPPDEAYLFRLWHDCGGRVAACASDAHTPERIGYRVADGYRFLGACGMTGIRVPGEGAPRSLPLVKGE